jgi:hypothetical protein
MRAGRVVMAGKRQGPRLGARHDLATMLGGVPVVQLDGARLEDLELLLAHAVLADVVLLELLRIEKLALARRVVVDRDQADQRQVDPAVDRLDGIVGRDLAAQVQAMLGARQPALAHRADRLDHAGTVLHAVRVAAHVAQRQRIEHRGDTRGGDLGVVRHNRGEARPLYAGTWREVLLHVVGMQLDQAGHQVVALEVDRRGAGGVAGRDLDDAAIAHNDGAVELGIAGNDAAVGEDLVTAFGVTHAATPGETS